MDTVGGNCNFKIKFHQKTIELAFYQKLKELHYEKKIDQTGAFICEVVYIF